MSHGYALDVKREFWKASGQIRARMDSSLSFHEANAQCMERAASVIAEKVNTLWIDRLCEPWFQL